MIQNIMFYMTASLGLGQSYGYHTASEITLKGVGKPQGCVLNHNKTQVNITKLAQSRIVWDAL